MKNHKNKSGTHSVVAVQTETIINRGAKANRIALQLLQKQNLFIEKEMRKFLGPSISGICTFETDLTNEEILKMVKIEHAKNAYFYRAYPELMNLRRTIECLQMEDSNDSR